MMKRKSVFYKLMVLTVFTVLFSIIPHAYAADGKALPLSEQGKEHGLAPAHSPVIDIVGGDWVLNSSLQNTDGAAISVGDPGVWPPENPVLWQQLPDLSTSGLDIFANSPKVLADDFTANEGSLITDIHFWGGWFNGYLPQSPDCGMGSPNNVSFTVTIRANSSTESWQQTFLPGEFTTSLHDEGSQGFFNPNTGQYTRYNQVWQYDFYLDEGAFNLPEDSDGLYWLEVSASPTDQQAFFGWRTSDDPKGNSAVWDDYPLDSWNQLQYPSGHELEGQSVDLAFAITTEAPEPATLLLLGLGAMALRRRK